MGAVTGLTGLTGLRSRAWEHMRELSGEAACETASPAPLRLVFVGEHDCDGRGGVVDVERACGGDQLCQASGLVV